jgi:hypothetical protein
MPTMRCKGMTAWQPHRLGAWAGGGMSGCMLLAVYVCCWSSVFPSLLLNFFCRRKWEADVDRSVNLGVTARICQSASPRLDTSAVALARPDQHRSVDLRLDHCFLAAPTSFTPSHAAPHNHSSSLLLHRTSLPDALLRTPLPIVMATTSPRSQRTRTGPGGGGSGGGGASNGGQHHFPSESSYSSSSAGAAPTRSASHQQQQSSSSLKQHKQHDHSSNQSHPQTPHDRHSNSSSTDPSTSAGPPSSSHRSSHSPLDPRNLTIMSSGHFAHPSQGGNYAHTTADSSSVMPYAIGDSSYGESYLIANGGMYHDNDSEVGAEEMTADDDDDDDLSTSSGRRHGNLLQPEPEDYAVTEVSSMTPPEGCRPETHGLLPRLPRALSCDISLPT